MPVERPALYNAHEGTTNSRTDESRKIEVNIAQLQTYVKKLMQHDENLAIPESPEVSSNCSKLSIGDGTSQNEHLAKTPFSPLPQLLKVNTGGVAFTVGVEQPVHKVLSPRAEFLRYDPDLLQNLDFDPVGAAPGSSVTEILASPETDNLVISDLR